MQRNTLRKTVTILFFLCIFLFFTCLNLLFRLNHQTSRLSSAPDMPKKPGMKRILVTGGAGFVGSHLVDYLMKTASTQVFVIDDLSSGSIKNIEQWLEMPNFSFIQSDIRESTNISDLDEIYHLASPASPPLYMKDPIKTLSTNSIGTLNILKLSEINNAKFLLASTSEVYGDPEKHPQSETYWGNVNPYGPRSCYDEGKRFAETATFAFKTSKKIPVRVARIFNTYGPRMNPEDGRVVSNFITQVMNNHPVTIFGDGSQTRSFQYVSDLVSGLVHLMQSDIDTPVNLGNPNEISISDLSKLVHQLLDKRPIKEERLPKLEDDPHRRKPDIDKARVALGWQPKVNLTDGLVKTISYFKSIL